MDDNVWPVRFTMGEDATMGDVVVVNPATGLLMRAKIQPKPHGEEDDMGPRRSDVY